MPSDKRREFYIHLVISSFLRSLIREIIEWLLDLA